VSSRFPRISAEGRIASGSGTIVVDGTAVGPGFEPQWYGPSRLMVKGFDDKPHTIDLTAQTVLPFAPNGPRYTHLRAGGGQWIGAVDRQQPYRVACSRTGQKAWVVEHGGDNNDHSLFLDGVLITRGSVHNPRVEDGYLVWTEGGGTAQRTWGRTRDGLIVRLHASGDLWEGAPIPVLTPAGPWVVVMTNADLRAYPWGSTQGKMLQTGENQNFDPDAIWFSAEIVVVWSDAHGTLPPHRGHVRLDDPRVELNPPIVMPPPDPPVPPIPPIPEEETMIAYAPPVPGFLPGELEPHPDGGVLYAVRKPNGKVLCCTPDGVLEERESAGPWEGFRKSGTSLIAERGDKVYVLPLSGA
jgi:hypothetical protein